MSSEGNTEDVIIDFCNALQQEQREKKRKSYSYGLQCAAMDCNNKQYSWKNGIRTSANIPFFSFPKDDAGINVVQIDKTM